MPPLNILGSRELAQWLRTFTTLSQDWHMVTYSHMWLQFPRVPLLSFVGTHVVHIHTCRQSTHTWNKYIFNFHFIYLLPESFMCLQCILITFLLTSNFSYAPSQLHTLFLFGIPLNPKFLCTPMNAFFLTEAVSVHWDLKPSNSYVVVAAVAVFLCVWVFGIHACLVPVEAQKGHQILRNWGYRSGPPQLELQMGVNCHVCVAN